MQRRKICINLSKKVHLIPQILRALHDSFLPVVVDFSNFGFPFRGEFLLFADFYEWNWIKMCFSFFLRIYESQKTKKNNWGANLCRLIKIHNEMRSSWQVHYLFFFFLAQRALAKIIKTVGEEFSARTRWLLLKTSLPWSTPTMPVNTVDESQASI